ncbi:TPA: glycosyltransferase family 4 protein [Streptococcus suis]
MKILITVKTYYPYRDGVQSVTQYLAEGLIKQGHTVTVLTSTHKNSQNETIYNGVRIVRFNLQIKHGLYFGDIQYYKKYVKDCASKHDVIVNVCTQNPFTDLLLPILNELQLKKVLYLHGMYELEQELKSQSKNLKSFFHKWWNLFRWGILYFYHKKEFKSYDNVIQLHHSDYAVHFFKKYYDLDSEIIENAADEMFFLENESVFPNEKYFLCVSNYFENKNQKMILESFYKCSFSKEIGLVFIGSFTTKYYQDLIDFNENLQSQYGERNVKFLVGIEREILPKYYCNSLGLVLGSKKEKFPVVIVEAMAAGIPFISTDVGCVKHLPGGIVVKQGLDMTCAMEKLVYDQEFAKLLAKRGKEYALDNLRTSICVAKFDRVLRSR